MHLVWSFLYVDLILFLKLARLHLFLFLHKCFNISFSRLDSLVIYDAGWLTSVLRICLFTYLLLLYVNYATDLAGGDTGSLSYV